MIAETRVLISCIRDFSNIEDEEIVEEEAVFTAADFGEDISMTDAEI